MVPAEMTHPVAAWGWRDWTEVLVGAAVIGAFAATAAQFWVTVLRRMYKDITKR